MRAENTDALPLALRLTGNIPVTVQLALADKPQRRAVFMTAGLLASFARACFAPLPGD